MKKTLFIITILAACICNVFADTSFRMSDGTRVSGKIINVTNDSYMVETKDGIITINKSDVQRIKGRTTPDFRIKFPLKEILILDWDFLYREQLLQPFLLCFVPVL